MADTSTNKTADKPADPNKAQDTDPERDALIASGEKRQPKRAELGRGFGGGVGKAEG